MPDLRTAAQQALEALEALKQRGVYGDFHGVTDAIRAALEQPEQVDVLAEYTGDGTHRQWVSTGAWLMPGERVLHSGAGYSPRCPNCASLESQNSELDRKLAELSERHLTDEAIADLWHANGGFHHHFARAIERWIKGQA